MQNLADTMPLFWCMMHGGGHVQNVVANGSCTILLLVKRRCFMPRKGWNDFPLEWVQSFADVNPERNNGRWLQVTVRIEQQHQHQSPKGGLNTQDSNNLLRCVREEELTHPPWWAGYKRLWTPLQMEMWRRKELYSWLW